MGLPPIFVHPKRKSASRWPKEHRLGENEFVQFLPSEEISASTAELPAPDLSLPTVVLAARGKRLTLSLTSISGTCEAGLILTNKDQLYPPLYPRRFNTAQADSNFPGTSFSLLYDCTQVGSTLHWSRFFSKPRPFMAVSIVSTKVQ